MINKEVIVNRMLEFMSVEEVRKFLEEKQAALNEFLKSLAAGQTVLVRRKPDNSIEILAFGGNLSEANSPRF